MDMNLNKLQEIVEDRGAWHATVHVIAKSWTQLGDWKQLKYTWNQCRRKPKRIEKLTRKEGIIKCTIFKTWVEGDQEFQWNYWKFILKRNTLNLCKYLYELYLIIDLYLCLHFSCDICFFSLIREKHKYLIYQFNKNLKIFKYFTNNLEDTY